MANERPRVYWIFLVVVAVVAVVMPWPSAPEPHVVEKLRWLVNGELTQPVDIFDLLLHLAPTGLLLYRLYGRWSRRAEDASAGESSS